MKHNSFKSISLLVLSVATTACATYFLMIYVQTPYRLSYSMWIRYKHSLDWGLSLFAAGFILALASSLATSQRRIKQLAVTLLCSTAIGVLIYVTDVGNWGIHGGILQPDTACHVQLYQIDRAKKEFASSHDLTNGTEVSWVGIKNKFTNGVPECPSGGIYTLGKVGDPSECSIHK